MELFVQYFIPCTQLSAGNKILYKKYHLVGTFLKVKKNRYSVFQRGKKPYLAYFYVIHIRKAR
jgi:hypothetical protein